MSPEEFDYIARWSDSCDEEVSRKGDLIPCEKPAVAVRRDPDGGGPYPVCAYHARGDMVPLSEVIRPVWRTR